MKIFLSLVFLLYSTLLFGDTYLSTTSNLDSTSSLYIDIGVVKKNDHDQYTITLSEAGNLSIVLGGDSTVKFAFSSSSMPDTSSTDATLTTYGPQSYPAGQIIYVSAHAPGQNAEKSYNITFTLSADNTAPNDITLSNDTIDENTPLSSTIGTFTTTDVDTGNTHTYSFIGGVDDASFNIVGANLTSNTTFDFATKNEYNITVRTTDNDGATFDKDFTIHITAGAQPIIEDSQIFDVDESVSGGFVLGTVVATNSPTSFSITNDSSDNNFTIDSSGQISVASPSSLDYATTASYILGILATNDDGSDEKNITINVTSIDAPDDSNTYSCDIFANVIVTYDHLDVSGTNNGQACGTDEISYPAGQISGTLDCLSDIACGGTGASCDRIDPPANQLTYNWTHPDDPILNESPTDPTPLTDLSYGHLDYSGGSAYFNASFENPYNDNKYMYIGDATFDQTLITFTSGDYYFESFSITKNKNDVDNFKIDATNGPVRIFIRGDISLELNNLYLNGSGSSKDLFIYVGDDFINPGSGGGNTHMNAYFYVEGDVLLNNNSNNWIIEGGITAEGSITIEGNNPDFIQSDDAGNLGYGACTICFQEPSAALTDISTTVLNQGLADLSNVIVSKAYTYAGYTTNTHTTTTGTSSPSSTIDVSTFNSQYTNFASTANGFVYNIGNFTTDQSETLTDDTSITFNLDDYNLTNANQGNVNALFIADYTDDDKNYKVAINMCWEGGVTSFELTGPFDAWDIFRDNNVTVPADRNISTKIVNKPFQLSLASLDENSTAYEVKTGTGNIEVALYPTDSLTAISNTLIFDANTTEHIATSSDFNVTNASKDTIVGFKLCATYESGTYTLYPIAECSSAVLYGCDEETSTKKMLVCRATDNLAIRPNEFEITAPAGEDIELLTSAKDYNLSLIAEQDNSTSASSDYNITNAHTILTLSKTMYDRDDIIDNSLNGTLSFSASGFDINDGSAINTVGIKFTDVGKVDINISDTSWSDVDIDDTSGDCSDTGRYICGDINATFIPSHFVLNDVNLSNFNANSFTYISNQMSDISAQLTTRIQAQNNDNNPTRNFDSASWENNVSINIIIVPQNTTDTNNITITMDSNESNISNLSLGFSDSNRSIVTSPIEVNPLQFNFKRDINVSLNPFFVTGNDVNISVTSLYTAPISGLTKTVSGSSLSDNNATFVYGRTNTPRTRIVGPTGSAFIYYEVFCNEATGCNKSLLPNSTTATYTNDPRWFVNTFHTNASGIPGTVSQKGSSALVTVTTLPTGSHPDSVALNYNESKGYPYKTTMENNASSWLLYNRFDAGDSNNEFEVEFEGGDSNWAGQDDANITTKKSGTQKVNRRSMW